MVLGQPEMLRSWAKAIQLQANGDGEQKIGTLGQAAAWVPTAQKAQRFLTQCFPLLPACLPGLAPYSCAHPFFCTVLGFVHWHLWRDFLGFPNL